MLKPPCCLPAQLEAGTRASRMRQPLDQEVVALAFDDAEPRVRLWSACQLFCLSCVSAVGRRSSAARIAAAEHTIVLAWQVG